jgi:hypothetical protein
MLVALLAVHPVAAQSQIPIHVPLNRPLRHYNTLANSAVNNLNHHLYHLILRHLMKPQVKGADQDVSVVTDEVRFAGESMLPLGLQAIGATLVADACI